MAYKSCEDIHVFPFIIDYLSTGGYAVLIPRGSHGSSCEDISSEFIESHFCEPIAY